MSSISDESISPALLTSPDELCLAVPSSSDPLSLAIPTSSDPFGLLVPTSSDPMGELTTEITNESTTETNTEARNVKVGRCSFVLEALTKRQGRGANYVYLSPVTYIPEDIFFVVNAEIDFPFLFHNSSNFYFRKYIYT